MNPSELLAMGGGVLPIALIVGVANFLTVLAMMRALAPRDLVAARARSHAKRRRELREDRIRPRRRARQAPLTLLRRIVSTLKLDDGADAKSSAEKLAQAGWRSAEAVPLFMAARLVCPLLLGMFAYGIAPAVLSQIDVLQRLVIGGGAVLGGAYLPGLLLRNQIQKRMTKIQQAMPDALDLFVICTEAGLSLDAATTRVGREIGASAPELSDELGLTAIELGFLPDRRDALKNLARRIPTPQVRGLVNTLVQTERYGTPLAGALRVLASEFRDTRMMKAEEKAARLPATLTVPMIVFILPPLFIVLIGPAIIQALSTSFG